MELKEQRLTETNTKYTNCILEKKYILKRNSFQIKTRPQKSKGNDRFQREILQKMESDIVQNLKIRFAYVCKS